MNRLVRLEQIMKPKPQPEPIPEALECAREIGKRARRVDLELEIAAIISAHWRKIDDRIEGRFNAGGMPATNLREPDYKIIAGIRASELDAKALRIAHLEAELAERREDSTWLSNASWMEIEKILMHAKFGDGDAWDAAIRAARKP